jgi:hypothetical protein
LSFKTADAATHPLFLFGVRSLVLVHFQTENRWPLFLEMRRHKQKWPPEGGRP